MSAMPTPDQSLTVVKGIWGLVWPVGLFWLAGLQKPVGDVKVKKSDEEWEAELSPMAYKVLAHTTLPLARHQGVGQEVNTVRYAPR